MSGDYDSPAPGVYREDQGRCCAHKAQLDQRTEDARHAVHTLDRAVGQLNVALGDVRAGRDRQRLRADDAEAARDKAREQAAECMREAAQLHKALDSLGTSPERLAQQIGAGEAVTLYGRTYVDHKDAARRDVDKAEAGDCRVVAVAASSEADRGLYLPIPAGYMLSVTVTPYDSTPLPDED